MICLNRLDVYVFNCKLVVGVGFKFVVFFVYGGVWVFGDKW